MLLPAPARGDAILVHLPRDSGSCYALTTYNQTPKWAWITVYDLARLRHLDYGWVAPFSRREWRAGRYACGSYYYVRAEVKRAEGTTVPASDPGNIFDTTVQAHFLSFQPGYVTGSVVYLKTKVNTAYADQDPSTWAYDNKGFWWDVDDSFPSAGHVAYMYANPVFVNSNATGTGFTITPQGQPQNVLGVACVDPNGRGGGPRLRPGNYHVKAVTTDQGCVPPGTGNLAGHPIHTAESDFVVGDQHQYVDIAGTASPTLGFIWK